MFCFKLRASSPWKYVARQVTVSIFPSLKPSLPSPVQRPGRTWNASIAAGVSCGATEDSAEFPPSAAKILFDATMLASAMTVKQSRARIFVTQNRNSAPQRALAFSTLMRLGLDWDQPLTPTFTVPAAACPRGHGCGQSDSDDLAPSQTCRRAALAFFEMTNTYGTGLSLIGARLARPLRRTEWHEPHEGYASIGDDSRTVRAAQRETSNHGATWS